MEHQARPGIPRKKKKELQRAHKPTHTIGVKDPPAHMPPKQVPFTELRPTKTVDQATHGKVRHIPKKHKTAIDAEFAIIRGLKTADNGYDPINRTNVFEHSQDAVVPAILLNNEVKPEDPADSFMRTDEFQNASPIEQEIYKQHGNPETNQVQYPQSL